MSIVMWIITAAVLAALLLWGTGRIVMRDAAPPLGDEEFPFTPLQRASLWSIGLSIAFAAGAGVILGVMGPERAMGDDAARLGVELLAVAALAAAGGGAWWVVHRAKSGEKVLDERDRAILERAPAVQSLVTILALAAWTVLLTQQFRSTGQLPVFFLQLIFWSCLVVNLLGLPAGVLMGYRRS